MNVEMRNQFFKMLVNSMNTDQIRHLGEKTDSTFDLYKLSGISKKFPIQRQTAADTLLQHFNTADKIVELFTEMLINDGGRFYNTTLNIAEKDKFMGLLERNKWIYDPELHRFFRDPFYEHEINFLEQIRVMDLRHEIPIDKIIANITKVSKKLSIRDLEWRITVRMYDINPQIGELLRKIIELLLVRQNLQAISYELFSCLKELSINASKANYKILFEKFVTRPDGITSKNNYREFLDMFKGEIEEHGNRRLLEMAKREDRHINTIFQSSNESIAIWVTNNANISAIEKKQIIAKLHQGELHRKNMTKAEQEYAEGAGLGINIILSILKRYTDDKFPLKVVFYPDFIKMGFELDRTKLLEKISDKLNPE